MEPERQTGERRQHDSKYWTVERIVDLVTKMKDLGATSVAVNEFKVELIPPGFVPSNIIPLPEPQATEDLIRSELGKRGIPLEDPDLFAAG